MTKKLAIVLTLCILLAAAVYAAGGGAEDPLASLSYLTGIFSENAEEKIEQKLAASDEALLTSGGNEAPSANAVSSWTETRLKSGDMLLGSTGTNVMLLAGSGQVIYPSGTVIDVTSGTEVASGTALTANHRYMVAEDTSASFMITSRTAVLDYQGNYGFSYSDAVDYNAMASALKTMNLFKGSFTGYGEGFDLEVTPTRLQALIMFIRVLGEEEEALAWTGEAPFADIHPGTQAYQYVGYAKEKGYTNGYTPTEFRPAGTVNAYQYTEFVLRAMGYSSVENTNLADTLTRAVRDGVLTDSEAIILQSGAFLRADLVYISYYALGAKMPNGSETLADRLIGAGVFTSRDWKSASAMVTSNRI